MNTLDTKSSLNLWPYAIITWFIIFAASLVAWVSVTVKLKTDLVSKDYYEEEVRFQGQVERLNRTAAIRNQMNFSYDTKYREILIQLPASHLTPKPTGQIYFYRPSNASLDLKVPLATDPKGVQHLGLDTLQGGLWNVRLRWTGAGEEYFVEQVIVVDDSPKAATTL